MNNILVQKKSVAQKAQHKVKEHEELDEHKPTRLRVAEIMYAWSSHKISADEHQNAADTVAMHEQKVKHLEEEI